MLGMPNTKYLPNELPLPLSPSASRKTPKYQFSMKSDDFDFFPPFFQDGHHFWKILCLRFYHPFLVSRHTKFHSNRSSRFRDIIIGRFFSLSRIFFKMAAIFRNPTFDHKALFYHLTPFQVSSHSDLRSPRNRADIFMLRKEKNNNKKQSKNNISPNFVRER